MPPVSQSVGTPLARVDGRDKVTGRAVYAAEHKIPNLCHAVMVMSTIPKGRITAIDTREAEKHPGVLAIMTHLNTPKLPEKPQSPEKNRPTDRKLQVLQEAQVYYANQPVALAVAETLQAAQEAAALVKVTYAAQPHDVNLEKRLASGYKPPQAGPRGEETDSHKGNGQTGLTQADVKLNQVYTTPFQAHNPMEMHATIAAWEGADRLTLYDATQGVFGDKQRVASIFGLEPDHVRVVSPYLGGGFGSKGPTWSHVILAAMAARRVQRPVKLMVTRPQMFGPVGFRSRTRQAISGGAKKDGTLTALKQDTWAHTSSFDQFLESSGMAARMLYQVPHLDTSHRLVRSDIGTPSFTRAPGWASGTNTLEIAIDELAYAAGLDPLAFRLKNHADQDPEKNRPWSSKSLRECYRAGAERFGWSKRPMAPRSLREGDTLIGWGMATSVYPVHRSPAGARARIEPNGHIRVEAATQDLGTGTYTIMTQIAADGLGVPPEQVTFRLGDTEYPETPVSGGSQTAASTGNAVHAVAQALMEKLVQLAVSDASSPLHGAAAADVSLQGDRLVLKSDAARGETLQALFRRKGQSFVEAEAGTKPGPEQEQFSMYTFGAQFAEVRVDAALGQLRVSRMVGAFGAGRILNPRTARSQFIGGMVWAIGLALYEDMKYDERLGRVVNNNLAEYHIPVNADVPNIEALWVEENDPHVNPLGIKGIGEIGITGGGAAIANAVFHATGKRVRDFPITLEKLL